MVTRHILCFVPRQAMVAPRGIKNMDQVYKGYANKNVLVLFRCSAPSVIVTSIIVYPYKGSPNNIADNVSEN